MADRRKPNDYLVVVRTISNIPAFNIISVRAHTAEEAESIVRSKFNHAIRIETLFAMPIDKVLKVSK